MQTHLLGVAVGPPSIALVFALPAQLVGLAGFIDATLGPLHAGHGWWSRRSDVEATA